MANRFGSRGVGLSAVAAAVTLLMLGAAPGAGAQSRAAPVLDPSGTAAGPRPIPGPVFESAPFTRAVARGTRTRTGLPGPNYWVQHPRYSIDVTLDVARDRVTGRETVVYVNRSPDSLAIIPVYLRQNAFARGVPRNQAVPITGGTRLSRVAVNGRPVAAQTGLNPAMPITASPRQPPAPGEYVVDGTVMWIPLAHPVLPGDSVRLAFAWSYTPPPAPADGREGHDGHVYFMGYWYPQIAVYDDVNGWVTDPYLLEAEFYMDPADYDVRITVPHGWVVDGTGTLQNASAVLTPAARGRLAEARRTGRVVRVLTPGADAARVFTRGGATTTWHFVAPNVRDFAWGTSDQYAWDATRALVNGGRDTVDINSFFRLTAAASAWRVGGARFTRDAIEQLSSYLWPYPWPKMSSLEGVLDGGGMEYPMMTLMQPWADTLSLAGDLMHETGHMWFPMQVGSNETRHPWMDEGLTQFDVAQGMRHLYGEPRTGGRLNDSEAGQRALYLGSVRNGDDASIMLPGDEFPQDLYLVMYYDKTAQILKALRAIVGPETFHTAYVEYGKRWIGKHPQPYDFFNTISSVSGRDLSWFWQTWFYHGWSLDQAVASVVPDPNAPEDSTAITIVDRGLAPMPVPIVVTRADGSTQRLEIPVEVWLRDNRTTRVLVRSEPRITKVEIDPSGDFPYVDRTGLTWTAH
jgi:Peptidase family M1 domain